MLKKLNALPANYRPIIEQQMRDLFPPISDIQWLGTGSVRVTFVEPPADLQAWDTRFAPFLLNWSFTHDDHLHRVYLHVPAVIRHAALERASC